MGIGLARRDPEPTQSLDPDLMEPPPLDRRPVGSRRWRSVIGVVAVLVMAATADHGITSRHRRLVMPSPANQSVEQWTAGPSKAPRKGATNPGAGALRHTLTRP